MHFKHAQIRLVESNEPLIGCGPLQGWLRKKRGIYAKTHLMITCVHDVAWQFTSEKIYKDALNLLLKQP